MTWIFGYGSLIWRPGFPYLKRERALLPNYERRFWQGSPDHRGTATAPGRVVTLVPELGTGCEGVAFLVAPEERAAVLERLDIRESGGYERQVQTISISGGSLIEAVVYIADENNPSYLGPASLKSMVDQIKSSRGPSGPNIDYVLNLKEILDEEGIEDLALNSLVRALDS